MKYIILVSVFTFALFHPICKAQTDQSLIYGTYLGGSNSETANDAVIDSKQDYWIAGSLTSSYDTPLTENAFQSSFAGIVDGYISIFSISGSLEYATFLGGSGFENIASVQFLAGNNGFVAAGYTNSTDFPVTANAYQTEYQGGQYDGFLARISETGELLWSTYFGGSEFDRIENMVVDSSNNIYVVGRTFSPNIATDGVYQTTYVGADAFLAKFDSSGNRLWCTYFGGLGDDRFVSVDVSPDGAAVYCGGSTNSESNVAINGWQVMYGGSSDAIIASFNSADGTLNWSSYYGGSESDSGSDLIVADDGSLYFSGETLSESNIASDGAHQQYLAGLSDNFLVKMSSEGNREWATYFGGDDQESFTGLTMQNNYVLLYGGSNSTNNIVFGNPIDAGISNGGNYIAKFDDTGQILWGTYILSEGPGGIYAFTCLPNSPYFVGAGSVDSGFNFSDYISADAYQLTGNGMTDLIFCIFEDNTIVSTREIPFYPLKIFPNPAINFVNIEIPQNLKDNLNLEIYDAMGKRVSNKSMTAGAAGIDISSLSSGVYIMTARTGKEIYRSKLIVE